MSAKAAVIGAGVSFGLGVAERVFCYYWDKSSAAAKELAEFKTAAAKAEEDAKWEARMAKYLPQAQQAQQNLLPPPPPGPTMAEQIAAEVKRQLGK